MRATLIGVAIVAAIVWAAACGRAEAGSAGGTSAVPVYRIRAVNYAFTAPATVPAGLVRMRMDNEGSELHHTQVVRLDSGRTFADLKAVLDAPSGPGDGWLRQMPAWVRHVGGPGAVVPGDVSEVTLLLEPGNYAILCYIPDDHGVSHFGHGMMRPLTVVPAKTPAADPPVADVVMVLDDYRFEQSRALRAGRQTIEVVNAAAQWHEVLILKMLPGKTGADFAHWEMHGREGPPPGRLIMGIAALDSGERNWFTVDLEPGAYALVCFYPDEGDGLPHFMHGMTHDFVVE